MTENTEKETTVRDISKTITHVYFDRTTNGFRCIDQYADRPNVLRSRDFTKDERYMMELASTIKEYADNLLAYNYGEETGDEGIRQTAINDCVESFEEILWDIFILEDYNKQQLKAA